MLQKTKPVKNHIKKMPVNEKNGYHLLETT